jgi:Bacterial Ig domain
MPAPSNPATLGMPILFAYQGHFTVFGITNPSYNQNNCRIYVNDVLKTLGGGGNTSTDFSAQFYAYGVAVTNANMTLLANDVLRFEVWPNSTFTGTPEWGQATVRPVFSYVELITPNVSNGILPTDNTDKSLVLNNVVNGTFKPCETTNVNGHYNIRPSIFNDSNNGNYLVNGVPITNSLVDFTQTGVVPSINGSGNISNSSATQEVYFNIISSFPYLLEFQAVNTFNNTECAIYIDHNNGFEKISSDLNGNTGANPLYRIVVNGSSDPTIRTAPSNSSKFGIEYTATMINWYVDGILIHTESKTVQYSTNLGTISNIGVLPLLTPVTFTANSTSGIGYIQANFNGLIARQQIQIVDNQSVSISAPSNGTCYSNNEVVNVTLANIASGVTISNINPVGGLTISNIDLVNNKFTVTGSTSGSVDIVLSCGAKTFNIPLTVCANTATVTDDSSTTPYNTVKILDVKPNDTVSCVGTTTYQINGTQTGGTFVIDNLGIVTYTPTTGFTGNATTKYDVLCDGTVLGTANITITVLPPSASLVDDNDSTPYNTTKTLNVITNDTIVCNGVKSYQIVSGSEIGGGFTIDNTGLVTYVPTTGFTSAVSGDAKAKYNVLCDGAIIGTANITITVGSPNANLVDDNYTTPYNTGKTVDVTLNDTVNCNGVKTYSIVSGSETGGTFVINSTTGSTLFTPTLNFVGNATADYNVLCDGVVIDTAKITIVVSPPPTVLQDDNNSTPINTVVTGDVTPNDFVYCTGTKTYRIKSGSEVNGSFSIDNNGLYSFAPNNNFIGNATAKYEVLCDGVVISEANINITVNCTLITGGTINGNSSVNFNSTETYSIGGLSGTQPFIYNWTISNGIIQSGLGTSSISVLWNNGVTGNVNCVISNCAGTGNVNLNKPITYLNCIGKINLKLNCGTFPYSIVVEDDVSGVNEAITNTLTSNTGDILFNVPNDGSVHNYTITITDSSSKVIGKVKVLNYKCK